MSNETLEQLLQEKSRIEAAIRDAMKAQRKQVLQEVRAKVRQFGLTRSEVFGGRSRRGDVGPHIRYADPATGKVWSGHGRKPKWFDPARAAEFEAEAERIRNRG